MPILFAIWVENDANEHTGWFGQGTLTEVEKLSMVDLLNNIAILVKKGKKYVRH